MLNAWCTLFLKTPAIFVIVCVNHYHSLKFSSQKRLKNVGAGEITFWEALHRSSPFFSLAHKKCAVEFSLGQRHSRPLDPPPSFRRRNLVRQQQQQLHPINTGQTHLHWLRPPGIGSWRGTWLATGNLSPSEMITFQRYKEGADLSFLPSAHPRLDSVCHNVLIFWQTIHRLFELIWSAIYAGLSRIMPALDEAP